MAKQLLKERFQQLAGIKSLKAISEENYQLEESQGNDPGADIYLAVNDLLTQIDNYEKEADKERVGRTDYKKTKQALQMLRRAVEEDEGGASKTNENDEAPEAGGEEQGGDEIVGKLIDYLGNKDSLFLQIKTPEAAQELMKALLEKLPSTIQAVKSKIFRELI